MEDRIYCYGDTKKRLKLEYKHIRSACNNNAWKQAHKFESEQEGYEKNLRENRDGRNDIVIISSQKIVRCF